MTDQLPDSYEHWMREIVLKTLIEVTERPIPVFPWGTRPDRELLNISAKELLDEILNKEEN